MDLTAPETGCQRGRSIQDNRIAHNMNDNPDHTHADAASDPGTRVTTLPCPYCGAGNPSNAYECESCAGIFEPLSRQATQNAMGPWFVRDSDSPFSPGCSYETLRKLVRRGRVVATTVVRGPSTNQFWMHAKDTPGVAILLGMCHTCHAEAKPEDFSCNGCGSVLSPATSRDTLGLAPVMPVNRSPIAAPVTHSPTSEAAKSLTLGGFVPITSPNDTRNTNAVGATLSPYLDSAATSRPARPEAPSAPRPAPRQRPQHASRSDASGPPIEHQATIRRLRTQIRSTKMINVILLIVCGLLTVGLVLAIVLPGALEPQHATATPQTAAAPVEASPVQATDDTPPATTSLNAVDGTIREARELASQGTEEALGRAIALLNARRAELANANGATSMIERLESELEQLNDTLDDLRLERVLRGPADDSP